MGNVILARGQFTVSIVQPLLQFVLFSFIASYFVVVSQASFSFFYGLSMWLETNKELWMIIFGSFSIYDVKNTEIRYVRRCWFWVWFLGFLEYRLVNCNICFNQSFTEFILHLWFCYSLSRLFVTNLSGVFGLYDIFRTEYDIKYEPKRPEIHAIWRPVKQSSCWICFTWTYNFFLL